MRPPFPSDLQAWPDIRCILEDLKNRCVRESCSLEDIVFTVQDLYTAVQAGYHTNDFDVVTADKEGKPKVKTKDIYSDIDYSFCWYGLFEFLMCNCVQQERLHFQYSLLPAIINLVLSVEHFIPEHFSYSRQQKGGSTVLSKALVARILACSFFCLFPERPRDNLNSLCIINFTNFFRYMHMPAQVAKFKMIINYFERIIQPDVDLSGHIVYCRQVIGESSLPTLYDYLTSTESLCSVHIHYEGNIEDIGSDGIQVDFANRFIGGGVLGYGSVQEEIRFCECPELIAALLFMESMEDNEAIVISGFEQFSFHVGYADSLEYGGDYHDTTERDEDGNLKTMLCAIDATKYQKMSTVQYELTSVLREVNKALVGFCLPAEESELENMSADEEFQSAVGSFDHEESLEKEQTPKSDIAISLYPDPEFEGTAGFQQTSSQHFRERIHNFPVYSNLDCSRIDDRIQQISPVVMHPQNSSSDLLDVNYGHKMAFIRRRSSNLSDVSRRSSSSTKHSSDLSSDLEEIYELYLKNEKKKHETIPENGLQTVICDFAANLVSHLMEEGITVAAQTDPEVLLFDSVPPDAVLKPYVYRPKQHLSQRFSAIENYANNVSKSVMNSALPEAAVIIKYLSVSFDSAISASQSSLPEDECYHLFADQIVQDVFQVVSNDYASGLLGNLSADSLIYDFGASHNLKELSANSTASASSACSSLSNSIIIHSANKTQLPNSQIKDCHSIAAAESSGYVPISTPSRGCDVDNSSLCENENSVIPKISDELIMDRTQNAGIPVSYQEAAAIIVDQVFQSLPNHIDDGNKVCAKRSAKDDKVSLVTDISNTQRLTKEFSEELSEPTSAVCLPNFGIPTKHLSREMLTNAFLNVEVCRQIKSYERRSSEPCRISVGLSLKTYTLTKPSSKDEKKIKFLRTDDDFPQVHDKEWMRRGSWSSFPTNRRNSSGFKDPVLSKFAEELMKADTSVPPLLIMPAQTGTSTSGSHRSSGFRDLTLATLEGELLNSSFCMTSSPQQSIYSKNRYHPDRYVWSDSTCSETEHWFPLPKKVGHEFQEEFDRLAHYHSVDEIEDFADSFANNIIQQAVGIIYYEAGLNVSACCLYHPNLMSYAAALAQDIIHSALLTVQNLTDKDVEKIKMSWMFRSHSDSEFVDSLDVPFPKVQLLASGMADEILKSAFSHFDKSVYTKKHFQSRGLAIATGNWGCGAFRGDPQLKCVLQWIAASEAHIPSMHYYTFSDDRLTQIEVVISTIESMKWSVGDLMKAVNKYCSQEVDNFSDCPSITFFEFICLEMYK